MELFEKTLSSERVYQGKIINLRVDRVELPNGSVSTREIVEHNGGVSVLPVSEDGSVYLVRQFRKAAEQILLEAPAGKIDPGEGHFACGSRELKEETGFHADRYRYLGYILPTPGYVNEKIHLYLACGLRSGAAEPDADEFVDLQRMPLEEAYRMALHGEIRDAKTVVLLLKAKEFLKEST